MDARLRVLYLLAVAVGVFFLKTPLLVGGVLAVHIGLWFAVGLPAWRLLRQCVKLWVFALLIVVSYALTGQDPLTDHWVTLDLFGWQPAINTHGLEAGITMVLRLLTVVMASQIARAGDPRAVARGLRKLGLPKMASVSIDTVLALFGTTGKGRGRGKGRGGGGGGHGGGADAASGLEQGAQEEPRESFWVAMKRVLRGDLGPLLGRLERQIAAAEKHALLELGEKGRVLARDVGIVAGVSLTMLGIKVMKLLPSVPFAPGHKGVLLLPLYVAASRLTKTRFGGTATGLTMGTVAFLMGDGRYGVFEIVKHVAPGVFCDVFLPLILAGGRRPGALFWSRFGRVLADARFGTIFAITLLVQAPAVAYAVLLPGLTIHSIFGFLSGYVSYHLLRGLDKTAASEPPQPPVETAP